MNWNDNDVGEVITFFLVIISGGAFLFLVLLSLAIGLGLIPPLF